ncbi:MAG: type I methionyl aminopeptidase [Deltaproteobacteria bacterium]|nr:type I methionyl aminopeptidase [Deltaproteobacteria bacterium]MCW5804158.1 type I methionyl aminopeptidase [Deltaproteobacteria bacterium]
MGIVIKNAAELVRMRRAGDVARAVLDAVEAACVPGVSTAELDRVAARELARWGATSAYAGYRPGGVPPFPGVLCTSINHVVVHGIPSPRDVLREGDLISIDFACYRDGFCADATRTVAMGIISAPARQLLDATRACLARALAACGPGSRLGDLGAAIERHAGASGHAVVRQFVGHGIGRQMHEDPAVPNYGTPGTGRRLKPGMTLAIEPMLTTGDDAVRILSDRWTVVTADHSLAAHLEHTIAITDHGADVLAA